MLGPGGQYHTLRTYAKSIGFGAALKVRTYDLWSRLRLPVSDSIWLRPENSEYRVKMRTGNSSDRDVFSQIFVYEEYKPIVLEQPSTIIDLGANVGYSSAYFLSKYPSASVIAVEPSRDNFALCAENLKRFGARAKVIHGAVWPERTELVARRGDFRDGREWATRVSPAQGESQVAERVPGYDMGSLLDLCGSSEINLLKIDIEGSEAQLFSRNTENWLPRIKNICIELHGDECARLFGAALREFAHETELSGELTICRNLRRQPVLTEKTS